MIIEKKYALHEYQEEELFLNEMAREGKCLVKALGESYQFEECEPADNTYKVVYSVSNFDPELYEGFKLMTTFTSSKGGHYHYLLVEDDTAELPFNRDRNLMLEKNLSRIERFNGVIIGSLLVFFIFLYINYKNPLYFTIIIAAGGFGAYVYDLRNKIKKAMTDNDWFSKALLDGTK